jgi:hypothetical protein
MQTLLVAALLAACKGDDDPVPPGVIVTPEVPVLAPGSRPLSRLNATEYDATVRDLLGTDERFGYTFPVDESAYGFDNVASVLTTTSNHVEGWEVAADELLDEMFGYKSEVAGIYGTQAEAPGVTYLGDGVPFQDTGYAVYTGGMSAPFALPYDGEFEVTLSAFGRTLAGQDPLVEVWIDGQLAQTFEVGGATAVYEEFAFRTVLDDGVHTIEVLLVNPLQDGPLWRAVVIDHLRVDGPLDPQVGRTEAYDRFVPCALDGMPTRGCASDAIDLFGRMAWRRPLTADEVDWALTLYDTAQDAGLDRLGSLRHAFKGILVSPEFVYRFEQDPEDAAPRELDGFEVATRLAAFAWSSTPDEALLDAAASGELATPEGVGAALDRLLADEKAEALVDNLAGQWFAIRDLERATADAERYPEFDDALRASMQTELRYLMRAFFRDGVPLDQVLTAQTTWVDARLAQHYGVPFDGEGDEWVQTSLAGTGRAGLFGTAGWLKAESRVDAPSAVKRGKWIVENLLCSPPPPPPPDVESMVVIVPEGASVREQEEAQRSDAYCQGCHSAMDPLGFALWGFDGVGARRTVDELGFPIDSETTLDGVTLEGPTDVAEWVSAHPRMPACVAEKALTYALGRPMELADDPIVDRVTEAFVAGGQTFDALAAAIVKSEAFRMRGAPEVE